MQDVIYNFLRGFFFSEVLKSFQNENVVEYTFVVLKFTGCRTTNIH